MAIFSVVAIIAILATASSSNAQLSGHAGVAVPIGNEAEFFNKGIHLGAALKLPLIPLQFEAALDRMGGKDDGDDLTILSAGAVVPIGLTPPLLPVGVYAIAGGGLYRVDAGVSSSDGGITGGAGIRIGLPGLAAFVEGRGVLIFAKGSKVTYLTGVVGLRL